jgi:hypothetical protein
MEIDGPPLAKGDVAEGARAKIFGSVFVEVPPPVLAPQPPGGEPPAPSTQVQQKRQSTRLMARPSSVPVALRAQHRLMRQLDFVRQGQAIGDEVVAQYEEMYQSSTPMPKKTVATLVVVTWVASGMVMAASAALAADAKAVQVEAA